MCEISCASLFKLLLSGLSLLDWGSQHRMLLQQKIHHCNQQCLQVCFINPNISGFVKFVIFIGIKCNLMVCRYVCKYECSGISGSPLVKKTDA